MPIILCDISSLEYWRHRSARNLADEPRSVMLRGNSGCADKPTSAQIDALLEREFSFLSRPVHLLVPNERTRCRDERVFCHTRPSEIPCNSFIQASEDVFVYRPEPTFIQTARKLPVSLATLIGLELCGTYRLPVGGHVTQYQVPPLASIQSLRQYAERARGMYGTTNAKRALQYVIDGSESPMESNLYELLCFSKRIGGRGLSKPNLNHKLATTESFRRATGKKSLRCDLFWPEYNIAVEYDSSEHHTGPDNIADDATRRAALASLGIKVVTVTNRQVKRIVEFDVVVELLEKLMLKRKRPTSRQWRHKELELRSTILPYGASCDPL